MKNLLLTVSAIVFSFVINAQNNDIEVAAKISHVTIYNSSAEINYKKEINLLRGKTTLIFTDLTPFIVDNTVNLKISNPDVDIMTVTEKINYTKERKNNDAIINSFQDSVSFLKNEIGLHNCKVEALKMEKSLLFKDESIGGVSKGISVAEIEKASIYFNKRYAELSTELYKLVEKVKLLQLKSEKFTSQINELAINTATSTSEIIVTVTSSTAQTVVFDFSFLTDKAGWAPIYDCRYQGANTPIKFIFRANVFNATGTTWDDVAIKLSTSNPMAGFNTPSLNNKNSTPKESVNGIEFREIQVNNSIAEYDIQHKYSIPSDSKPYMIDVNTFEMIAEYNYLLIPKLDIYGFLMAKIPNWNKYNLIPGTTNIYNKGSYMGKTFLNTYTENDTLSVFLGKDNNIQAVRKEISTNNSRNIIGNYFNEKSEISIFIKNTSSESFKIEVLDQVPVYSDKDKEKLTVQNIEKAIYNNKDGLLTWNVKINSNEVSVIDFKYDVKIPKDEIYSGYKMNPQKFKTISCPSF